MSPRYRAIAAAVAVLVGSGIGCHLLARDTDELDAAVARVPQVPMVIGAWQGKDEPLDEEMFDNAGARGRWTRVYVNQRTQESVLVILMCGRAGKMGVHTPEVCYRGAGYEVPSPATVCEIESQPAARFWTAQFTKKGIAPTNLRLCWAWSAGGEWEASTSPRWQYCGAPFLYKLYVSRTGGATSADATQEFLRQFVPVLNRTLFAEQ